MVALIDDEPQLAADGRRRRRQQNRDTVIDALIALFERGTYQPSAQEIATEAGVSERSLFRYFDDLDDLSQAAITRLVGAARPLVEVSIDPAAPLPERIDSFVAARIRLYSATAAAQRAARITAHRRRPVAAQLKDSRSMLRRQVSDVFATEIRDDEQKTLLAAIDALTSFETYDLFRTSHRLSEGRIATVMRESLSALLDRGGSSR